MANGNNLFKKVGIAFSILVVLVGTGAGYGQLKEQTIRNKADIKNGSKKMDDFNEELTILKVQNAKILEIVLFLKERAK